jgi:hypothetical protein
MFGMRKLLDVFWPGSARRRRGFGAACSFRYGGFAVREEEKARTVCPSKRKKRESRSLGARDDDQKKKQKEKKNQKQMKMRRPSIGMTAFAVGGQWQNNVASDGCAKVMRWSELSTFILWRANRELFTWE